MIISHKHKFIFFHLQKTGGTSIAHSLFPCLGGEDEVFGYDELSPPPNKEISKHSTCMNVFRFLGMDIYKTYFKFAFVRNPYDLFASLYHWWQETSPWDDNSLLQSRLCKINNFEEFCEGYEQINKPYNFLYKEYFFCDKLLCDYVGRYETLQKDYDLICDTIGLQKSKLDRLNKSNRDKNYRVYYNENCIKHVKNKYKKELKVFNYEF